MELNFKEAIKKPWVKYTLVGIGSLGFVYIVYQRVNGGANRAVQNSTGISDSQAHDLAQIQMQNAAIGATAASQNSSQSYGLATLQEKDKTGLTALQYSNAETLALANIQLSGLHATLDAQTTQQQNAINGTVSQAQILANEQMHISDTQAGVNNNAIHNAAVTQQNQSNDSLLGQVLTLAAFALF